ncbi:D-alanyl-D-alanine carboxypeptidase [Streptomyces sp. LB8]|uniref:D-alanyl-D-alanine carboxypeptidase n=1 Tax=Streptomyces sp. LB8 TaxID=3042509 RepID=UPI002648F5F4|nr:D-alanyl-D-alanine carboxypeptidase [Streptomyces sp. LB8]MDN5385679.1 D-alanyl-D-alanine carboxypeptidase [Streptomyces sp. LB8]
MEEASVAGESPDRSKQRESSAQPTSGSTGTVPEARDGARGPRLSPAGDSESSDASEERGGVDTTTRVLLTRDLTADGKDAEGAGGAGEGEDARAEKAADGVKGGGPQDGGVKDAAGAADVRSEGAVEPEGSEGSEKPEKGEKETRDSGSGEKDGASADARPREKAAARADDADAEDISDVEGGADSGEEDGGSDNDADGAGAKGAGAVDGAPKAPRGDDAQEPGRKPDGGRETGDKQSGEQPVDRPTTMLKVGGAAKPRVDQPTTMLKVGGAAKPRVDQPTTRLKVDDAEKAGKLEKAEKTGAAEKAEKTEKAERLEKVKKAVDLKKTVDLKKSDKPEEGERGKEKADKQSKADKPAAESDSERTSKFVALKSPEDPETRKPRPAQPPVSAGETVALPRVSSEAAAAVPQLGPERTTQQPLPPKPPLDLLAELTNTPPPPETPLRTLVRRIKIWSPLVVLLAIIFAIVQALRPLPTPTLALSAKDTYTFDGDKVKLPWPNAGQGWMSVDGVGTMDHFGEQKPVAIGSVAKTMTAYVILREHPLKPGEEGPKIKIDARAEKEGGYDKEGESTLNTVKEGDVLTQQQALYALMIPSANNIARLLARWDAGSEEEFVKKMNDTAKELGMTNTTYTDPSGLDKNTVSTAEDQVKLGIAAMRIPAMVAITSVASWTDPSGKYWSNHNQLPYTIGAIGIKTGNTSAAGGNLLFATRKKVDGQTVTIVGAILSQRSSQSTLDLVNAVSKTALLAAQDVPTSAKILKKGDVVGYVDDRLGGRTPVVVTKDVTAVGWSGLKVRLNLVADSLPHEAKAGTKVGTLTVGDGKDGAIQVPVALQKDLVEPGFTDKLTRIG